MNQILVAAFVGGTGSRYLVCIGGKGLAVEIELGLSLDHSNNLE